MKDETILIIDDAPCNYYNDGKNGNGESIAIDVLGADELKHDIEEWYEKNGVGSGSPVYYFKDYKTITIESCFFKMTPYTKIVDINGRSLSTNYLDRNSRVSLVVRAVPYDNEFGKGVTHSVELVMILNPKENKTNEYLKMVKNKRIKTKKVPAPTSNSEDKTELSPLPKVETDNDFNSDEIPF